MDGRRAAARGDEWAARRHYRVVPRHQFEIWLMLPLLAYVLVLTVAPIIEHVPPLVHAIRGRAASRSRTTTSSSAPTSSGAPCINTLIVASMSLVLELGVGLIIALTLHASFRGRGLRPHDRPRARSACRRSWRAP